MKHIEIFGIKLSKITKKEVVEKVNEFLVDGKQHYVVTPNPEFLLQAGKDEEFFYILNQADLAIPDGIGLKFASWAMGINLTRISGADLVPEILKMAEDKGLKVAVVNWKGGLSTAQDIESMLKQKFPRLNFHIVSVENRKEAKLPAESNSPDILFATFGAPYQEKFIFHNLKKAPSVKLAAGVGASFDYLTGKTRRAPKIWRNFGFEWLWRLLAIAFLKNTESNVYKINRLKRINNAIFVFPLKFLRWRFILPYRYRASVVCLLYKKQDGVYKILLVERADAKDTHWQLPQGGTDGEPIEVAGRRELSEELNCNKFVTIKTCKNLYNYIFPRNMTGQKHSGYKGQSQSLFIAEFTGVDSDIRINFWDHTNWKWVDKDDLVSEVHSARKESAKIFLAKLDSIIEAQRYAKR
jgi:N-acetylglucosaminyldiphosphoundecaprenol N-acetyl-beta-D-mannosaminyltransferase